eukprot:GILK01010682.1.p1 GENE.GILK01010682.1~~GILK01010682.1.p1  ORF type:complete len:770 (-),score=97.48 GILK01010682.1:27-2336(-)
MSIFSFFLFLLYFACESLAFVPPPRPAAALPVTDNIDIGTSLDFPADIVAKGKVMPSYSSTAPVMVVSAAERETTLYATVIDAAIYAERVSASSTLVSPSILTTTDNTIVISYGCTRAGLVTITVAVGFGPRPKPSLPPAPQWITFSYKKQCGGSYRSGFRLGTTAGIADILRGGQETLEWESGDNLSSESDETAPSFPLFFSMDSLADGKFAIQSVSVQSTNPGVAVPSLEGPGMMELTTGSKVLIVDNTNKEIQVVYNCLRVDQTNIIFNITPVFPYEPFEPLSVRWRKKCGGYPQPDFRVGTAAGLYDIWNKGSLHEDWDFQSPKTVRSGDERRTIFYVSLDKYTGGYQMIEPPIVVAKDNASLAICSPSLAPSDLVNGGGVTNQPQTIEVDYKCRMKGMCYIQMYINMEPHMSPYGPVQIGWQKDCGGRVVGIDVYSTSPVDKTSPVPDVMRNGRVLSNFNYTASREEKMTTFHIALNGQKAASTKQNVAKITGGCTDDGCSPSFSGTIAPGGILLDGVVQNFTVKYNCRQTGWVEVYVTLKSEFYEPVYLTWYKDCWVWYDTAWGVLLITFIIAAGVGLLILITVKLCQRTKAFKWLSDIKNAEPEYQSLLEAAEEEAEKEAKEEEARLKKMEEEKKQAAADRVKRKRQMKTIAGPKVRRRRRDRPHDYDDLYEEGETPLHDLRELRRVNGSSRGTDDIDEDEDEDFGMDATDVDLESGDLSDGDQELRSMGNGDESEQHDDDEEDDPADDEEIGSELSSDDRK